MDHLWFSSSQLRSLHNGTDNDVMKRKKQLRPRAVCNQVEIFPRKQHFQRILILYFVLHIITVSILSLEERKTVILQFSTGDKTSVCT